MNFKEWVKSDEFAEVYLSMPSEMRAVVRDQIPKCGSNGSGNHFWELQKDQDGNIWFMIHSGSRKLGHFIATYYDKIAKELNKKWYSSVEIEDDLAFLPLDTKEGQDYVKYMQFACKFASFNHEIMTERTKESIQKVIPSSEFTEHHYITHNYAALENHFGQNVMVHRKGATLARENTVGIIPGSQGSKSYIVKGKGNPQSFMSCSHGAGRKMGRKEAIKSLDFEAEKKFLDDQGIIHSIRNKEDLDEATGSYKNIDEVMKNQEDLVEILVELTPLGVIKG